MIGNPWQVASLQDFLYLKCPECTFDTQEEEVFEDHALQNHKLSFVFFGEIFVKDEKLNSKDDHKDPLTINGEIRDQSCVTSSENLSLAPIFPNISNIKEELIDNSEFFEKIENNAIFKRPKPHVCSICDRGYTTAKRLKQHFEIVHEGKKLKTKGKIKQEAYEGGETNNDQMQKCEYCDYTSTKKSCITKHERKTHPESAHKPFKCRKCDYFCLEKKELTKHDREIHNSEKIQCPKCDKKVSPDNLRSHIKEMHEKIFPFLCNTCGYKATSNGVLKNHIDLVHEGKRHICQICGLGLSTPTCLKKHIACVHEGKKPYKCELCDTRCLTQSGLKIHIRNVHDKIKPLKCNECQKSFRNNTEVKKHITIVHEKIKAFKCPLCDKKFSFQNRLHDHNMRIH